MIGQCKQLLIIIYGYLEKLVFSDKIKKINMFGWVQQRYFLITNDKVYNLKKNKIKRSIKVCLYM